MPVGYLPQRLDVLDDDALGARQRRAARPGADVERDPGAGWRGSCSGARRSTGRPARCRAASGSGRRLAALLLADPAPQLLLLDEPTNNLDLARTTRWSSALAAYRGALVVASHDVAFLEDIEVVRIVHL